MINWYGIINVPCYVESSRDQAASLPDWQSANVHRVAVTDQRELKYSCHLTMRLVCYLLFEQACLVQSHGGITTCTLLILSFLSLQPSVDDRHDLKVAWVNDMIDDEENSIK